MTYDVDVDNDGDIDAADIARVRMSFGTSDPVADINADGIVNAQDIGLVRKYAFTEPVGTPNWDAEEEACFVAINEYRAHPERWLPYTDQQGNVIEPDRSRVLQPLQRGYRLSQAASWHAIDMAEKNYLSHTDSTGRDMGARVVAFFPDAKYGYSGEVALGTDGGGSPAGGYHSFVRWTLSPPHNGILLSNYVSVGIGHAIASMKTPPANDYQHRWVADFSTRFDGWP